MTGTIFFANFRGKWVSPPYLKKVTWTPAFGGPLGFSLVSLMDNTALILGYLHSLRALSGKHLAMLLSDSK